MLTYTWPNVAPVAEMHFDDIEAALTLVERLQSAGPIPEIPFEVHNTRPIDPDRAMDAVRAMCG